MIWSLVKEGRRTEMVPDSLRSARRQGVSRTLHVERWGDPAAPRAVCLHGITGHGGGWRRLAETRLAGFHVLAPDLIGHGSSPVRAAVEHRGARRHAARDARRGAVGVDRPLVRRPARLRARRATARRRRAARPARPRAPDRRPDRALRRRGRPRRTARSHPSTRGSTAASSRASSPARAGRSSPAISRGISSRATTGAGATATARLP